ncbi:MAG: tetratricopeptide repeat-containing glycosyltransferase family protein [Planctomycetota bacterium]
MPEPAISLADLLGRAWQVHQSGNVNAAMQMYRGVLRQVPRSAEAWVYLGIGHFDQRDFDDSVTAYRKAITLKPEFPIAWNNLGNSLRMLGDIEQADSCFAKALEQQPEYLSAIKNRGTLWVWSGEIQRGLAWYEKGLQIDPQNAELHRNLGVIRLLLGDFEQGFPEYRWRWRMPGVARPSAVNQWASSGQHVPVWSGQDLNGKTITLYPEQGLGDAIQFLRVAMACRHEGARVTVVCDPGFTSLFSTFAEVDNWIADGVTTNIPATDFQASFLEVLDVWYEHRHSLWTHFGNGAGYLSAHAQHVDYWGRYLDRHLARSPSQLRVGLNWQGNPEHHADVYRSIPLSQLQPIATHDQIDAVSLQFGDGRDQLDDVTFAGSIMRLPQDLDRDGKFVDTAAIVENLDVVVTSDTSLAHLAGSLGKRVHLMLGRIPDWRWRTEGDNTVWYPSMQLHRQRDFGDWSSVMNSIVTALRLELQSKQTTAQPGDSR